MSSAPVRPKSNGSSSSSPSSSSSAAAAVSQIPVPRTSVQEKLLYAIDLLRRSEIEKQELLSKINRPIPQPAPQRERRPRRKPAKQSATAASAAGEEQAEAGGDGQADDETDDADFEEKEEGDERQQDEPRAVQIESKEEQQRTSLQQPAAAVAAPARGRAAEAGAGSRPASKPPSARSSLPNTARKQEEKTAAAAAAVAAGTPRRTTQSSPAAVSASPVRPARSTPSKSPFTTPPKRGSTVSVSTPKRASPPSTPPTTSPAAALHRASLREDGSILQTYVRFVFSPAQLVRYRGDVEDSATRFESIEWLRVETEGGEEEQDLTSIHSESLKGRAHDDEATVVLNTKQLSDGDLQRQLCVQLWTHSDDVDAVDMDSGRTPQHDLLLHFTATVPEMAEFTQDDAEDEHDDLQQLSDEDAERRRVVADFFHAVEVVLEEQDGKPQRAQHLDLEIAIEQERMRLMQSAQDKSAAALSALPPPSASSSRKSRTSGSSTPVHPQRSGSAGASVLAPTLSSMSAAFPPLLDDMSELIMPDRVFARRQRMKAEERKRKAKQEQLQQQQRPDGSASSALSTPVRSSNASPHHSPVSSRPSSPKPDAAASPSFTPFEPQYYRVRVSVAELPKMNFHGTADSYFHILLAAPGAGSGAAASGSWQSLYRSEVQFNQLNPRFASFVLSSVRERDARRQIVLRMINWRQRVAEGHEEIIGEVTVPLSTLIPQPPEADAEVPTLQLHLVNPVRSFIGMKAAGVGVVSLHYTSLSSATFSIDTAPSSAVKSVSQKNKDERKAVRSRQRQLDKAKPTSTHSRA